MGKRTAEFVLGLIGGMFGFFGALVVLMLGGIAAAFGSKGTPIIIGLGFLGMIFSIIGVVGAILVKGKTKLGGWMMIISAIGGVISVIFVNILSYLHIISFILLMIAGSMAVKNQLQQLGQQ